MPIVALDLLGGDGAPDVVADAAASLLREQEPISLILVGPEEQARDLLAARGLTEGRLSGGRPTGGPLSGGRPTGGHVALAHASRAVRMDEDPLRALREDADASVSVAARLVAKGSADAWVSVGHTGAAVAAAVLELGRIPGMSRPALAVVVPGVAGRVVLLDAGAAPDATPDLLRQFAVVGHAYAEGLGAVDPAVGLLTIGSEDGKGDQLRRSAHELLRDSLIAAGIRYAGPVEGHDVALGERAQVIVTDGFTGNVVLKALEGAVQWAAVRMGAAYGDIGPARGVVRETATSEFAGGMLLGVQGVTVIGHGAGSAEEIAACVRLAARAADAGLARRTSEALAGGRS